MKKGVASILCVVLLIISMASSVYASGTTLKIGDALCFPSEIINVPITISGNTGIAGAVIDITYDSNLELIAVNRGEAFGTLAYTPPGKLTSNPIRLLWDGMEADASNGVIVTLQFLAPTNGGSYNVCASYEPGGIYDGDMEDINVVIDNGTITVEEGFVKENTMSVTLSDKVNVELNPAEQLDGEVYVALYGGDDSLLEIDICTAQKTISSELKNINTGKYIKVFWLNEKTLTPYCEAVKIDL